jgi:hypothetical protein
MHILVCAASFLQGRTCTVLMLRKKKQRQLRVRDPLLPAQLEAKLILQASVLKPTASTRLHVTAWNSMCSYGHARGCPRRSQPFTAKMRLSSQHSSTAAHLCLLCCQHSLYDGLHSALC